MNTLEILLLALGLSMDAFAVTISNVIAYRNADRLHRIMMPIFFGAFQGLMPVVGYFAGSLVSDFIESYAGIITFVILGFIGGKMIYDAVRGSDDDAEEPHGKLTYATLFFQAIATSIDALAVGVSFAALSIDIVASSTMIGITTALCCVVALAIARKFGQKLGDKATIVGGLVLIAIGVKSLFS